MRRRGGRRLTFLEYVIVPDIDRGDRSALRFDTDIDPTDPQRPMGIPHPIMISIIWIRLVSKKWTRLCVAAVQSSVRPPLQ
jgi:hypothetical protein